MLWFTANVEDIQDPKELGRVKVRIHGLHCDSKTPNIEKGEGIATDALPWAIPMQDISSAADAGIGRSPTGMKIGTVDTLPLTAKCARFMLLLRFL